MKTNFEEPTSAHQGTQEAFQSPVPIREASAETAKEAKPWTQATKLFLRATIFFSLVFVFGHPYFEGEARRTAGHIMMLILVTSGTGEGYDVSWPARLRLLWAIAAAAGVVGFLAQGAINADPTTWLLWIAASGFNAIPWLLWDQVKRRRE